mmetsp:Transcript_3415/g.7463  ORF Transcript_3415/g.7463 Transcript_3415/m.7463 type:complete len:202 (-) Transcript_3415:1520-2125(-)
MPIMAWVTVRMRTCRIVRCWIMMIRQYLSASNLGTALSVRNHGRIFMMIIISTSRKGRRSPKASFRLSTQHMRSNIKSRVEMPSSPRLYLPLTHLEATCSCRYRNCRLYQIARMCSRLYVVAWILIPNVPRRERFLRMNVTLVCMGRIGEEWTVQTYQRQTYWLDLKRLPHAMRMTMRSYRANGGSLAVWSAMVEVWSMPA